MQDVRFQFKKKVKVLEKPLKLTYTHMMGENQTSLNGMLELNSANKLSADYEFDFGDCKLMYSYAHGGMTLEPCYDFGKKSLDLTMSQRILDGDLIGASYKTSSKTLGLEWSSNSKYSENLRFKVWHYHVLFIFLFVLTLNGATSLIYRIVFLIMVQNLNELNLY